MRKVVWSLFAFLLASAPLVTQEPRRPERAVGIDRMVALEPAEDGAWLGLGPDYKVHFAADHFSFVPILGAAAPHDLPLQMTVRAVDRGTMRAVGPASLRPGQLRVDYARPELVEVLELRPDGLKQSFVLETLPAGRGDLVVRADVATELVAARGATDGPLLLAMPGAGGVTIGTVTGIDADGRRTAGSLVWSGDTIDFVLPAVFVETARLPLTVDPLLSTTTAVTNGTFEERAPVVAHLNASLDLSLLVFRRTISAANHDLVGLRVTGTGAPVGAPLSIEATAADAGEPQVAEVGTLQWIVVWERAGDIVGARVLSSAGAAQPLTIAASADDEVTPDIGGMVLQPFATVAWRNATSNTIEVCPLTVTENVTVGVRATVASGAQFSTVGDPALTQSNTSQRALLTYTNQSTLLGTQSVRGQLLLLGAGLLGTTFAIAGGSADAFNAACAGDGTVFVVAYETAGVLGQGLSCISVRNRSTVVELGQPRSLTPLGSASANPDVAWCDGSALVAWTRPNGTRHDVMVTSVDPFTCTDCEGSQVVDSGGNESQVAICSQFGHNASPNQDRASIVWTDATGTAQVRLRQYQAVDGVQDPLGGSCGTGGRIYGTSARVGNAQFGLQMVAGAPGQASLLLLSTGAIAGGFACGTCTVHPDTAQGLVLFNGISSPTGSARYDLPLPAQAGFVGVSLFAQFVGVGSNCQGSFDLSPALRVELQ